MKQINSIDIINFDITYGEVLNDNNQKEKILVIFFEMDEIEENIPYSPLHYRIYQHNYNGFDLSVIMKEENNQIELIFKNIPNEQVENISKLQKIIVSGITEKIQGGIVFAEKAINHSLI